MKMKCIIPLLFVLLAPAAFAQVSMQGTDFYLAFGNNHAYRLYHYFHIKIAAVDTAEVTLTFKANGSTVNFTVNAGTVYTYTMDSNKENLVYTSAGSSETGAAGISNRSVRVQSSRPVSVTALNQSTASGQMDATAVWPVATLGTDYYQLSYKSSFYNNQNLTHDGYMVIATENNTIVYEDDVQMGALNAGEIFFANYGSTTDAVDITGRRITSNHPVAYFVTNGGATVPYEWAGIASHLYEQMLPVDTWGKTFLVPTTRRGRELVRVMASQNNTKVNNQYTLNAGEYAEFEISGLGYISADKPVAVATYLVRPDYEGLTVEKGLPALAWAPPLEQTATAAAATTFFYLPYYNFLDESHALIVSPTATRDQTTVATGSAAPVALSGVSWNTFTTGINPSWSYCSYPLSNTSASVYFYNPNGLIVLVYGLGDEATNVPYSSYYYAAGASARKLDAAFYVNNIHYQDVNGRSFCGGQQSFALRAAFEYEISSASDRLRWFFNNTEDTSLRGLLEGSKTLAPGAWTIRLEVKNASGVTRRLSTAITVKNQATAATITTTGTTVLPNATATLTGASTGGVTNPVTYRWYASQTAATPLHTGATFTTPQLAGTTTYYVSVEGGNYCENVAGDRKEVTVKVEDPSITVEPIEDLPGCITTNIPATAFSSPVNGVTFKWTNSNPAIGLAASGDGNQPEFTAAQTGSATITVTPYNNGVSGVPRSYTIKVVHCVLPVNPHLMIRYK